jgi:hypothetical protein
MKRMLIIVQATIALTTGMVAGVVRPAAADTCTGATPILVTGGQEVTIHCSQGSSRSSSSTASATP